MTDVVGAADMQQGANTSFIADRFGNPDSALALNGGWTFVPAGVYFNTQEFTISVWVYPQMVGSLARVFDFGNPGAEDILLALDSGNDLKPYFAIFLGGINRQTASSQPLVLNEWQFLVATFKEGSSLLLYINGVLITSASATYGYSSKLRTTNNFIGKSNWNANGYSSSYLDDLRFYNVSLTQAQINGLMTSNNTHCNVTSTTTTSTTTSMNIPISTTKASPLLTFTTYSKKRIN